MKWINFIIPVDHLILTDEVLENSLKQFFKEFMSTLKDDQYVMFLFRMEYEGGLILTLGPQQKINKSDTDMKQLLNSYIILLEIKDERYKNTPMSNIILSYKIIPEDKLVMKKSRIYDPSSKIKKVPFYTFFGYNLPLTTDLKLWGELISSTKNKTPVLIKKPNSNILYLINITQQGDLMKHHVFVMQSNLNNKVTLEFEDIIKDKQKLDTFTRIIINKKQEYHFIEGKLKLKIMDRPTSYLKSIKVNKQINEKFITMDIESRKINNISTPYLVGIYDGLKDYSFYLNHYNNIESMLKEAFTHLLKSKYNQHKIYLHNLSFFDGVFMLNILNEFNNSYLTLTRHEGKLINMTLSYGKKYHIHFRDSLLMLPLSLYKLARSFKVALKGIFPIFAPNELPLDYIGTVPHIKYFKDISKADYFNYLISFFKHNNNKQNTWSLEKESIKYCIQDCISLHQVLKTFNALIFDKFQLNIHNFPTLSSLAFGIFRAHYLKESKIPLITGQILNDIRQGYYGGATDMYKPSGKHIYTYDVNSLYPYAMKSFLMPVGKIRFFEGDILQIMKQPFGFFNVEITTPNNLKIPILLTRITKQGKTHTVSPLGTWKDIIFSEEMFNAMYKFGYKFKILSGYLFDKEIIFKEFVDSLYDIKCNSKKDEPMYLISKLLLNSLYGKFGMHQDTFLTQHGIVSDDELYGMIDLNTISDTLPLSNNKQLISFISDKDKDINLKINNLQHNMNISIGLSAATTAYARIHMSQFKLPNNKFTLLYTDTDSIAINKPLPSKLVHPTTLGKMKLENIFNKAVYLGPKVYGGLLNNFIVDKDGNCQAAITKVKGYKNIISFNTLESLLNTKDNIIPTTELTHDKWYRNYEKSEILMKEQIYTLTPTQNKRELIIKDNKIIDTKPYTINNKEIFN